MPPYSARRSAVSPLTTLVLETVCWLLLLPLTSSEIITKYLIRVEGTAMPPWCLLSSDLVPNFAIDPPGSLLGCGGTCARTKNCEFFCILGGTCDTFKAQVAPYFQGWTEEAHTVYDVCYTSWPGDPLNIVTPGLTVQGSEASAGSHPKFVSDGFICGKKVAPGFKGALSAGPFLTIDLGADMPVAVIKYRVLAASTVEDLYIAFGSSAVFSQNEEIVFSPGQPTVDEEEFNFDPPKVGRYLTFLRKPTKNAKMFIGEVTAYSGN